MSDSDSAGVKGYIQCGQEYMAERKIYREKVRKLRFDTIAVHGMYSVEEAFAQGQGGIIEALFPSTSQGYRDSDEMEAALSYQIPTWCYSRIHNPTIFYLEETLSLLEAYGCPFDASAFCTSLGMAAIKQAVEPLLALSEAPKGEVNFIASAQVYGGTFQLFNVRFRERNAKVRWVSQPWKIEEWEKLVDKKTRFLYIEMPSNPQLASSDLQALAELAHGFGIPLIVDSDRPVFGHLMSFTIKGSARDTRLFFDNLQRIFRATDLGLIKSVATIPAISTHQQQGDEGRRLAGIPATMVRLCVGGEHPDDIIKDLDRALNKI